MNRLSQYLVVTHIRTKFFFKKKKVEEGERKRKWAMKNYLDELVNVAIHHLMGRYPRDLLSRDDAMSSRQSCPSVISDASSKFLLPFISSRRFFG